MSLSRSDMVLDSVLALIDEVSNLKSNHSQMIGLKDGEIRKLMDDLEEAQSQVSRLRKALKAQTSSKMG